MNLLKQTFVCLTMLSTTVFSLSDKVLSESDVKGEVDTMKLDINKLDEMVRNNQFSSGSKPVMFTGEARIKVTNYNWGDTSSTRAGFMELDRNRTTFAEGNESAIRIGMLVRPNGHTILWSKLGFNTTLSGHYLNKYGTQPGYITNAGKEVKTYYGGDINYDKAQYEHDKDNNPIFIHEDMNAGLAVRYPIASFWVRMGNTLWTQSSPLTIWKSQPRNFAWDYLPFEIEQPISRYYDYNIAKGFKEGRAAWNKKPFQGIQFESLQLPWGLYFNFVYGKFENYDNFEPEYTDYATDRGFAYTPLDGFSKSEEYQKGKGISDVYRWMKNIHIEKEFSPKFTTSLNYVAIRYNEDYAKLGLQIPNPYNSKGSDLWANSPGQMATQSMFYADGFNFYKNVDVISLNNKFSIFNSTIELEAGASRVDTNFYKINFASQGVVSDVEMLEKKNSGFNPALYLNIKSKFGIGTLTSDIAYITKKFYSPFSFVAAHECIYPYGSNLLGAGKFVARGEASPYVPNMAGINLNFALNVKDGHAKFNAGYHFQPEDGFNAVYFPYILNGIVLSQAIQSSSTRWGNGTLDGAVGAASEGKDKGFGIGFNPYYQRLGLGSQVVMDKGLGDKGGIFADFLSSYEGFIAFNSAEDARKANLEKYSTSIFYLKYDTVFSYKGFIDTVVTNYVDSLKNLGYAVIPSNKGGSVKIEYVPDVNKNDNLKSKKFTHNYSFDGTYNLANLIGWKKKLYSNFYLGYYELSTSGSPTFNKKNDKVMLAGNILRTEWAFALTNKFYIIGLGGVENWFSNKSYMATGKYGTDSTEVVLPNANGLYITNSSKADVKATGVKQVNIDYSDIVYGIGFDWDIMKRTTFHFRLSHNIHKDNAIVDEKVIDRNGNIRTGIDVNGYEGNVISGEIKMWF